MIPTPSELNIFPKDKFIEKVLLEGGAEGCVYKAHHPIHNKVAIKEFHQPVKKSELNGEVELLIKLNHPHIISFYGLYVNNLKSKDFLGYVMEYMSGGSLHKVIYGDEVYEYSHVYGWIEQASYGLKYLHSQQILHRDIKPHNILISGTDFKKLKLSDFGLAKIKDHNLTKSQGTIYYMAPEMFSSKNDKYSFEVDIYSLTITFWEMIHRSCPYPEAKSDYDLLGEVDQKNKRPTINDEVNKEIADFLRRGWAKDAKKRPFIDDFIRLTEEMQKTPEKHIKIFKIEENDSSSNSETMTVMNRSAPGNPEGTIAPRLSKIGEKETKVNIILAGCKKTKVEEFFKRAVAMYKKESTSRGQLCEIKLNGKVFCFVLIEYGQQFLERIQEKFEENYVFCLLVNLDLKQAEITEILKRIPAEKTVFIGHSDVPANVHNKLRAEKMYPNAPKTELLFFKTDSLLANERQNDIDIVIGRCISLSDRLYQPERTRDD